MTSDRPLLLPWLRFARPAALLLMGVCACSPKVTKETLVLLQVDVAANVPAVATLRFSVPASPDLPARTAAGDPRPNQLAFGYYLPDVSGTVTILGEALDGAGCVLGQGQQTVAGLVSGQTAGPVTLSIARSASSNCPDGGTGADHPPSDGPARDGADGRSADADGAVDGGPGDLAPAKLGRGAACTQDDQCSLGHCTDSVCCESACTGSCESCGESDQQGTCVAVAGDPRGTRTKCTGTGTTCGGTCDGTNRMACSYPDENTACGSPTCQTGMAAGAPTCDTAGNCRSVTPVPCSSGACQDGTQCSNGCNTAGGTPCPSSQFCNAAGACEAKIATGSACSNDATCISGSCVDGHCCSATACGACQACTGAAGTCVPVVSADDPDTCAGDRTCDASGTCKAKPGNTCSASGDCSTGSCVDGHCCTTSACGSCQACTGGGGACVSVTGGDDPDTCAGTKTCDSTGTCKAQQGQTCGAAADCISGHCVDAVCCESDCTGECEACGESNQKGTCVAVMGTPRGSRAPCAGQAACTGMCDGANRTTCAFPDSNTTCGGSTCTGGTATSAPTCDTAGGCRAGTTSTCTSNLCADAMKCSGSCDPVTAPCAATQFCNSAGACQPKNPSGNACASDGECTSGHCVDGRCCGTATCGSCQSCTGPSGTCVAVTSANDPDSCTGSRTCTAAGVCTTTPGNACSAGTDCSTGNCVDGRCCTASACGTCQACTGGGGTCVPVTSADDDTCTGTKTCDPLGVCKVKQGQTCSVAEDCISGNCVDKVCCESACTGPCEACAETNQVGTCVAVAGTPRGVRLPCAGTGTACAGMCDGTNRTACAFPDQQTMCGNQSCANGIATTAPTCDHAGGCRAGTSTNCTSNLCASALTCSNGCDPVTAPCPATQYCTAAAACQTKIASGGMCSADTSCMSGHCIDGHCCGVSACGSCQSCTGAGGTCMSVTSMDDPDSCTGGKTCDSGGTCRGKPGQTCTANTDCATGSCVDGHCCTASACGKCQACTGGGGTCVAVIGADDPDTCTGTLTCDSTGSCKTKQGQSCAVGTDCVTGLCADQHCCNTACGSSCQSCANSAGTCGGVTGADDPDTCTGTRTCDASGTCRNKAGQACSADTDCSTAHCVDGHCCGTATCGTCQACTGANGACAAVVNAPDPDTCTGTQSCDATGSCKNVPGQTCTTGGQCLSGNCVDGQCCSVSACGTCQTCATGTGACTAIINAADPDSCTTDRSCDATGKCAYKIKALAASNFHTCALLMSGQVKCWGLNSFGQLGLGDTNNRGDNAGEMGTALPTVDLGSGAVVNSVTVGGDHSCALLSTGQVKCWGRNSSGQLGLGDTANRGSAANQMGANLLTVNLGTGRTAKAISAGASHTCALLDNSFVKCWGLNSVGQLGLGNTTNHGITAGDMGDALVAVSLGQNVTTVSAGGDFSCVLLADTTVKCWGFNGDGELGIGAVDNRGDNAGEMGAALPVVNLGTGLFASAVVAGGSNACALITDGRVKCWGYNFDGELGIQTTTNHGVTPTDMGDNLPAVGLGTSRTAKAVSVGLGEHTCVLLDNNTLKCWGINGSGQLGQGNMAGKGNKVGDMGDNLMPIDLGSPNVAAAVVAGGASTCSLLTNGELKCWGYNVDGELGLGDTAARGDNAGEMGTALPFVDLGP